MRRSIPAVSMSQWPAKGAFAGISEDACGARSYSPLGSRFPRVLGKGKADSVLQFKGVEKLPHLQEDASAKRGLRQLRLLSSRA